MKQESLEMLLKCCLTTTITNVNWQWVPSRWRWNGESSVSKSETGPWSNEVASWFGAKSTVSARFAQSHKYNGAVPRETRYIKTYSLNSMWLSIGSQCSSLSSGWLGLLCGTFNTRRTTVFSLLFPSGQTAVKLSGAEATDHAQCAAPEKPIRYWNLLVANLKRVIQCACFKSLGSRKGTPKCNLRIY